MKEYCILSDAFSASIETVMCYPNFPLFFQFPHFNFYLPSFLHFHNLHAGIPFIPYTLDRWLYLTLGLHSLYKSLIHSSCFKTLNISLLLSPPKRSVYQILQQYSTFMYAYSKSTWLKLNFFFPLKTCSRAWYSSLVAKCVCQDPRWAPIHSISSTSLPAGCLWSGKAV